MKLYFAPGACSLAVHIALQEIDARFDAVRVDLGKAVTADGTDYRTLSPRGYVPLLELDDGTRLREGPAIVQYIADQVPQKNLAPASGTLPRYRLQEWLNFIATELHRSFSPLFNPAMPDEGKKIYRDRIANRLQFVERELAGKEYVMGDTFTVADGYLYTVTRWARPMAIDLSALPNLLAWQARVEARPAVQEALRHEKLT